MNLVKTFEIPDRVCMDCGETFTATVERGTGKPVGCLYWGKINPCMKYQYFLKFVELDERIKISKWQKFLKKLIPDYYPSVYEPSVKPITARWGLHIREWWALLTDPVYRDLANSEMWTCHECTLEHEGDDEDNGESDEAERNNG